MAVAGWRLRLLAVLLATASLAGCGTPGVTPSSASPDVAGSAVASASVAVRATPSASPASGSPSAAVLRIRSVSNFRDVAGDGLVLPGGHRMATGVVYRSAKLTGMSRADRRALADAGLAEVLDLRTPAVAKASPDPAIPGATNHLVNLYAVNRVPAPRLRTVASARAYMRSLNVGFVASAAQRARVALTLRAIATASGPVLVHCSEGKDRTGWISAVLQLSAGATRDQVHAEYLKSNTYRAAIIAKRYRTTKAHSGVRAARIERAQLKVDGSYLDAGLTELERRYGSIDGYLADGLGLDAPTIAELRARLVA